jgi:hypothetical protein
MAHTLSDMRSNLAPDFLAEGIDKWRFVLSAEEGSESVSMPACLSGLPPAAVARSKKSCAYRNSFNYECCFLFS